jgi:uncharacterized protein
MRTTAVIHLVWMLCAFAPAAPAQPSAQPAARHAPRFTAKDFSIPGIFQYDFISGINALPYRITVAVPFGYSPSDTTRYPVLYMLDGDPNLPLTALIQWNMSYDGEVPNMIIVGIGYQAPNFMGTVPYRTLDYTPTKVPTADSQMTVNHHVKMVSGGAAGFLRVMTEEIMPFIGQSYKTGHDRSLAGHSFGGLFATYVLLNKPELFSRYLISSPSLYWGDGEMLREESGYYASGHRSLPARVFISAGASEPESMVPDVRELVRTLRSRNYKGLELTDRVFDDETHLSVIPFAISRGLRVLYTR